MSRKKIVIWVIVGLVVVLVALAVQGIKASIALSKIPEVQTERVERRDLTQIVEASGRINPVTDVEISANISSEIDELPVKEGDFVEKGDLLVVLDQTRYVAAIDQARAAVRSAEANSKLAKANLDQAEKKRARTKQLLERNLVSEEAYELADTQYLVTKATYEASREAVAQTRAALDQANDEFSKTKIVSPMNGTVSRLEKEVGEIAVGSTFTKDVIMVVADLTAMEMVAEVDENDVPDVVVGQKVTVDVDALPDKPFTGKVVDIARSATVQGLAGAEQQSTNFDVRISVEGDVSSLRPGMSATAEVEVAYRTDVLAVPIQCITLRDPNKTGDEARNLSRIDEDDLKGRGRVRRREGERGRGQGRMRRRSKGRQGPGLRQGEDGAGDLRHLVGHPHRG